MGENSKGKDLMSLHFHVIYGFQRTLTYFASWYYILYFSDMEVALPGTGITPSQGQVLRSCIALNVHAFVALVALLTSGTAHNSLPCVPALPHCAHPQSC